MLGAVCVPYQSEVYLTKDSLLSFFLIFDLKQARRLCELRLGVCLSFVIAKFIYVTLGSPGSDGDWG